MASRRLDDIRKKGYLFKLPVTGGVIKVWAKRWVVLHGTSHEGVVRLEYYDTEEAEIKGENKRVIVLRNCTGCIETFEFKKARPHAFQFSTQQGRHVFATDSRMELDSWIDSLNDAMKDDRRKRSKSMAKNTMASETARRESESTGHAPRIGTLMGVYHVILEPTELSQALNLSGTYTVDVNPRGMCLIARATETTITKWSYKHIKTYAKSSNKVTLEFGQRSPTGPGKFVFTTKVSKELFSMINRNIKKIRQAHEKAVQEKIKNEVREITDTQSRKKDEAGRRRTLRPHSMSYDVQPAVGNESQTRLKRNSSIDIQTSSSTIGTVDQIQLDGLAEEPGFEDFQDLLDGTYGTTSPIVSTTDSLVTPQLDSVDALSSIVYEVPSLPSGLSSLMSNEAGHSSNQSTGPFEDVFVPKHQHNLSDPFANVTDPFNTSTNGSFYNSKEDIFQNFEENNDRKTSTPNNPGAPQITSNFRTEFPSTNPFRSEHNSSNPFQHSSTNVTEAIQGLKDIQLNTVSNPPKPKPRIQRKITQEELAQMWDDIAGDFK